MNAGGIESAVSELPLEPFEAAEFPFTFLAAFGNKETALKRLRADNNNASDANVSKATATRHLRDSLEKGCIFRLPSGGFSTRCKIATA